MRSKRKLILTAVLTALLLLTLWVPAMALEGDQPTDEPDAGSYETAEPTLAPATEEPTPAPPVPTATPVPVTAAPTPIPTEAAGTVDLRLYVFTASGEPASGYTVSLSSGQASTDSQGLATFRNLPVAQQSVTITSPGGDSCTGRLYMSRSGSTGITDQAMGGTYGVDVARGSSDLYMVVTFDPGGPLNIRSLSNSQPALPTPQPQTAAPSAPTAEVSAVSYQVKALTATFLDGDRKPLSGLTVAITADDGTTAQLRTDGSGSVSVPSAPYGHYAIAVTDGAGLDSRFDLTINPAVRTGVSQNAGSSMVVDAATTANHLYLQFVQTPGGFTLTDAQDSPIGGADALVVGIIVVAIAVAVVIILIVLIRRRNRRRRGTVTTMQVKSQRKVNYDPSAPPGTQPKRTGGANKFDDRSKM